MIRKVEVFGCKNFGYVCKNFIEINYHKKFIDKGEQTTTNSQGINKSKSKRERERERAGL